MHTSEIVGATNGAPPDLPLCKCGCGERVKRNGFKWRRGHCGRGRHLSEEHRNKISKSNLGKTGVVHTEEFKRRLSALFKNRYFSPETRRKISESQKGIPKPKPSIETRRKMSSAQKGRKHTLESRQKMSASQAGHGCSELHRKRLSISHKGMKPSEETRKKLSIAHKNVIKTHEWIEKIRMSNTGKKRSPELRIRLPQIGKTKVGSLASNWQGGKSFEPYSPEFNKSLKRKIKTRDGNRCRNPNCKGTTQALFVHHIDYNKENFSESNLITLCGSCHSQTSGRKKRDYWTFFYTNLIQTPITKQDEETQ